MLKQQHAVSDGVSQQDSCRIIPFSRAPTRDSSLCGAPSPPVPPSRARPAGGASRAPSPDIRRRPFTREEAARILASPLPHSAVEQQSARQPHKLEVAGASPAGASPPRVPHRQPYSELELAVGLVWGAILVAGVIYSLVHWIAAVVR